MQKVELLIPLKINSKLSLNKIYSGCHPCIRAKDKERIAKIVKANVRPKLETFKRPIRLKMSFKSRLDVSNHAYLFKMLEDCLKELNYFLDDTDKYVAENIMCKQDFYDGVIIEMEELENDN